MLTHRLFKAAQKGHIKEARKQKWGKRGDGGLEKWGEDKGSGKGSVLAAAVIWSNYI